MKRISFTFVTVCLLAISCTSTEIKVPSSDDTTINEQNAYNNLFLDSSSVEKFMVSQDSFKRFRSKYYAFYSQRNYEFAWFDSDGMTEQAHHFYSLQNNFAANLNDSSIYNVPLQELYGWLQNNGSNRNKVYDSISKKTELLLTGQFFRYAQKVYHGSEIDIEKLGWYIPRKKINATILLDSLVDGVSKASKEYEPLNRQYRLLEGFLAKHYSLKKKGDWLLIPDKKRFKNGDSNNVVTQIKKRLFDLGDLKKSDTTVLFDTSLLSAVKQFQQRMGLRSSGIADERTLKSLNIPIQLLINKILINMERARWMPPDTSHLDKVVINIPEYRLSVFDSGSFSFSMPVVVGTAAHNTVIFDDKIKYIVFSPYWNIPTGITKKEMMPAMKRNKNYFTQHNIEIVRYDNGIPELRQKPGLKNALGGVKFLFPNKYSIYLHDTPGKDAFSNLNRPFSHGCIRVGDPKRLAAFLLRREPMYTADSINTYMTLPKEKWLEIKPMVHVIIKYFTAWVDNTGLLNFREDIYGRDKSIAEKLFEK